MTVAMPSPQAGQLAWLQALREPALALAWNLGEWEQRLRLARRLRLLARLAASLEAQGLLAALPPQVQRHLVAELRLSQWRIQAMTWALQRIGVTLGHLGQPLVLLKGAAYAGQGLAIAQGRLPSDVDILVPPAALAQAAATLQVAGWQQLALDEHDQRYYREWSHEVPPMHHPLHRIELDLHHNILPPVARTRVDVQLLLACLQPSAWPGWQVLHPLDQVLHSAAHLFQDSEARDRLRDLVDLDGLLRHFAQQPGFWDALAARAQQLGLAEPLALACHFCVRWLATPVPAASQRAIMAIGPGPLRRAWLLPMLGAILTPAPPGRRAAWQQDCAAALFLARYHRNRMPLRLLLPHLWHKLRTRPEGAADALAPAGKA